MSWKNHVKKKIVELSKEYPKMLYLWIVLMAMFITTYHITKEFLNQLIHHRLRSRAIASILVIALSIGQFASALPWVYGGENITDAIIDVSSGDNTMLNDVISKQVAIKAVQLPKPEITKSYTYNGSPQTVSVDDFKDFHKDIMKLDVERYTNAGTYTATLTLTDTANYVWQGEDDASLEFEWIIAPKEVIITPASGQFKYYGQADELSYSQEGLVPGEEGKLTGKLSREAGESVGKTYGYTLGNLNAGKNYKLALDETEPTPTFEIKSFTTEKSTDITVETPTKNGWITSDTVKITAPDGFQIVLELTQDSNGKDTSLWADTATTKKLKDGTNTITYYLKDNKTGGIIQEGNTLSVQIDATAPTVQGVQLGDLAGQHPKLTITSKEEGGEYYYIIQNKNDKPLTAKEIIEQAEAGKGIHGKGVIKGSTEIALNGLNANTEYVVSIVIKDQAGNISNVISKEFTPTWEESKPIDPGKDDQGDDDDQGNDVNQGDDDDQGNDGYHDNDTTNREKNQNKKPNKTDANSTQIPVTEKKSLEEIKNALQQFAGTSKNSISSTTHKLLEGSVTVSVESNSAKDKNAYVSDTSQMIQSVLKEEELKRVASGEKAEIKLTVLLENDVQFNVPKEDIKQTQSKVEELQETLTGLQVGQYVDIVVQYRLGEEAWQPVTEAAEEFDIVLNIPDDIYWGNAVYYCIRVHNEQSQVLYDLDTDSRTITIRSGQFSTYAIAYTLGEVTDPVVQPEDKPVEDGGEEILTVDTNQDQKEKCQTCGICFHPLGICVFLWLVVIGIIAVVVIVSIKRRKQNIIQE